MDLLFTLVTNPTFGSMLLGTATPTIYRFLEEGGLVIQPRLKTAVNILLSAFVSFVPLIVSWAIVGTTQDPEVVIGNIGLAFLASEATYRRWFKGYDVPVEKE